MPRHREAEVFSELECRVLDYAEALTKMPAEASDEMVAGLAEHLDDEQVVELTAAIAWENYRARFNRVLGVESEDFSRGAYCPLPVPHPSSPDVAAGPDSAPEPNDVAR
mgnify:CR=1 FL=1